MGTTNGGVKVMVGNGGMLGNEMVGKGGMEIEIPKVSVGEGRSLVMPGVISVIVAFRAAC